MSQLLNYNDNVHYIIPKEVWSFILTNLDVKARDHLSKISREITPISGETAFEARQIQTKKSNAALEELTKIDQELNLY